MTIKAYRGPSAAMQRTGTIPEATVRVELGKAIVNFSETLGSGESRWHVVIEPASFELLIKAMMHADPTEALKGFAAVLQNGIPDRKNVWHPAVDKPSVALPRLRPGLLGRPSGDDRRPNVAT